MKKLSEMTLEELWQLFPIRLTEYQPCWQEWYAEESDFLKKILPDGVKIHHIGSTALGTIWAKPIVDILVEIPQYSDFTAYKTLLVNGGYICMSEEKNRLSFNKGYTEKGFAERVFHLHLRYAGDNDEVYFRDYLMENPDIAQEYEALKLTLWKEFEFNRDGYTNAKTEFVRTYTQKARKIYDTKEE